MSVRFVHFADTHLGVEQYGRLDPATGMSSRVLDFLVCFDEIVDRAIAERVALAIFAGDAYKDRSPNPTLVREFSRRILRLAEAGIAVVIIEGNHDIPAATGRASSSGRTGSRPSQMFRSEP